MQVIPVAFLPTHLRCGQVAINSQGRSGCLGHAGVAVSLAIIVSTQDNFAFRVQAAGQLCHGLQVSGIEGYHHGKA
jgi:hypothetical protein